MWAKWAMSEIDHLSHFIWSLFSTIVQLLWKNIMFTPFHRVCPDTKTHWLFHSSECLNRHTYLYGHLVSVSIGELKSKIVNFVSLFKWFDSCSFHNRWDLTWSNLLKMIRNLKLNFSEKFSDSIVILLNTCPLSPTYNFCHQKLLIPEYMALQVK